jgi:cytochrome P450
MRQYAVESLQRYQRLVTVDPNNVKPTLFTKVFKAGEEDKLSFDEIRNDAHSFIIAGSDTTANTLTYLIWSVCKNPMIRDTLVDELRGLPDDFEDKDVRLLVYLNRVIDETLRLHSSVPSGLPREVPVGGAELAGYYFQARTVVSAQAYSLHRNPEVFARPDEFDLSRWTNPTKEMRDSFMAFGGGSRCEYISLSLTTSSKQRMILICSVL